MPSATWLVDDSQPLPRAHWSIRFSFLGRSVGHLADLVEHLCGDVPLFVEFLLDLGGGGLNLGLALLSLTMYVLQNDFREDHQCTVWLLGGFKRHRLAHLYDENVSGGWLSEHAD